MAMGAKAVFNKYDFIDTKRGAGHGWSGGGTATLNCLFQYPEIFHTGIAAAAVANQLTYDNIYQERYMGDPKESYQDYVDGSPIKYAKNLEGNLLYIHGTGDDNVHYQNAEMLANELIKNKKYPVLFYFYSEPAGQTAVNRYGAGYNSLYNGNLGEDGYVYVTFDGRGTPSPKGRAWRKAIYRKIGIINVRDMAMGAKAVFNKYDFIDTKRVAVH